MVTNQKMSSKSSQKNKLTDEQSNPPQDLLSDNLEAIFTEMINSRDAANEKLSGCDFKLYFQRVGQYAYLRWRVDSSVLSTKDMSKKVVELPDDLQAHIEERNQAAETLISNTR